jgi:ketosteroid isomerase-like protein
MTKGTKAEHLELESLANRLFDAVQRADIEELKQVYAPNVQYWMNLTDHIEGIDTLLQLTLTFNAKVKNLQYQIESREYFSGGLVQRCRLRGETATGMHLAVPLCLILHVEHGRIVRLYEYIDSTTILPALA